MERSIITWDDFEKVDLRIGTVTHCAVGSGLKKPALWLTVDLGELGVKKSSAQITQHYNPDDMIGRQVLCVTNFAPRQIGSFLSEVLITSFADENNHVVLSSVDKPVPNGTRLF